MNALRRTFVGSALAWGVLLPAATFAASRAHLSTVASAAALAVYAVGAMVCHQLPARSFHVWGAQMPVCARCTGIYFGAAAGAVAAAWIARLKPATEAMSPRALAVIAAAPAAATLFFEWTTGITPSNAIRFVSGVWLGAILAALVVSATAPPAREVN